jgi:methionine-gamma-lyase
MERHNANASALADMLVGQKKVLEVFYPGLETHPNHVIAKRQMKSFGGMIGFDLGSFDAAKIFVNNVKLCTFATSLGGVETIVQHSAAMTHAAIPPEQRMRTGISDGLIRLSVGIENVDDISQDLKQALMTI